MEAARSLPMLVLCRSSSAGSLPAFSLRLSTASLERVDAWESVWLGERSVRGSLSAPVTAS